MLENTADTTILIAEDDYLIAEEITRMVKRLGFKIAGVATNGIKAVEMAIEKKPDVILMDIKMPKMDGLTATRKIQEEFSTAFVILTAHESVDLVEEAGQSGIGAYLTKPPKEGEILRAISIAIARHRELEESKRLIRELEFHKKELNASNAAKDKFFSIIAHDLRNPVSAISAFSDQLLINFDKLPPQDLRNYIEIIRNSSHGISDLLEELLLWAGLQSNRYEFNPELCPVFETVEAIINLVQTESSRKNIAIQNKVPEKTIIYADKQMLHTIIRNLITNAIKFTNIGGNVSISSTNKEHQDVIEVHDSGVGMEQKELKNLFKIDMHATSPGTQGEKGTGLGLQLCKEMIEKHKGSIWAESKPGIGSSFFISFPKVGSFVSE